VGTYVIIFMSRLVVMGNFAQKDGNAVTIRIKDQHVTILKHICVGYLLTIDKNIFRTESFSPSG
jgi:hypothetical protein